MLSACVMFGVGYLLGVITSTNFLLNIAKDHFGLNVSIDTGELAKAIWRYKNMIG